jgi:hypothetical protein
MSHGARQLALYWRASLPCAVGGALDVASAAARNKNCTPVAFVITCTRTVLAWAGGDGASGDRAGGGGADAGGASLLGGREGNAGAGISCWAKAEIDVVSSGTRHAAASETATGNLKGRLQCLNRAPRE